MVGGVWAGDVGARAATATGRARRARARGPGGGLGREGVRDVLGRVRGCAGVRQATKRINGPAYPVPQAGAVSYATPSAKGAISSSVKSRAIVQSRDAALRPKWNRQRSRATQHPFFFGGGGLRCRSGLISRSPLNLWQPENCSAGGGGADMDARRRRGGGLEKWGSVSGPLFLCKNGCWRQRHRNTKFGPKKFFPPITPPPPTFE